jgi:hypothetical protein
MSWSWCVCWLEAGGGRRSPDAEVLQVKYQLVEPPVKRIVRRNSSRALSWSGVEEERRADWS